MATLHRNITAAERHPLPRYEFASLGAAEAYTYAANDTSCIVRVGAVAPYDHYIVSQVASGVGTLAPVGGSGSTGLPYSATVHAVGFTATANTIERLDATAFGMAALAIVLPADPPLGTRIGFHQMLDSGATPGEFAAIFPDAGNAIEGLANGAPVTLYASQAGDTHILVWDGFQWRFEDTSAWTVQSLGIVPAFEFTNTNYVRTAEPIPTNTFLSHISYPPYVSDGLLTHDHRDMAIGLGSLRPWLVDQSVDFDMVPNRSVMVVTAGTDITCTLPAVNEENPINPAAEVEIYKKSADLGNVVVDKNDATGFWVPTVGNAATLSITSTNGRAILRWNPDMSRWVLISPLAEL